MVLAPGVAASVVVMQAGFMGADVIGQGILASQGISGAASPISGIPVSILLGLGLNNMVTVPTSFAPGLKFCTTTVLRGGIICVGAKLSALDVMTLGAVGVPAVAVSIATSLAFVTWFGRVMGLPPRMSSLIAAGTSICGVTAITALAPAIKADEKEMGIAVANVVAFGTLGMLTYPYLAHALLGSSEQVGLFLGLAIHDTSQVIGSALTYKMVYGDEVALQVAAITKLTRNLCLAAVIPGLAYVHVRNAGGVPKQYTFQDLKKFVPLFVVGFVGMACVRSGGDVMLGNDMAAYGVLDKDAWKQCTGFLGNTVGTACLGTAMAAVGLSTSAKVFKGVGPSPFIVGMAGCAVTSLCGFSMAVALAQIGAFGVPS